MLSSSYAPNTSEEIHAFCLRGPFVAEQHSRDRHVCGHIQAALANRGKDADLQSAPVKSPLPTNIHFVWCMISSGCVFESHSPIHNS